MRKFYTGRKDQFSKSLVKTADLDMTKGQEIEKKLNCQCCDKHWNQILKFLLWNFNIQLIFHVTVKPDSSGCVSYAGVSDTFILHFLKWFTAQNKNTHVKHFKYVISTGFSVCQRLHKLLFLCSRKGQLLTSI